MAQIEVKRFGDLKPGDILIGSDGEQTAVTQGYDEHIPEKMFEVELENGQILKVSGNHLWYVETKLDYSIFGVRVREARKEFKRLTRETVALLEEMAKDDTDLVIEVTLAEMLTTCECDSLEPGRTQVVYRIAESLGPIVEQTFSTRTDEYEEDSMVPLYNGQLFARQVLSLMKPRKYPWKVIVGRVVETQELVDIADQIILPDAPQIPKG